MEFLLLASAHFMALLSPGPDFFLIMRFGLREMLSRGLCLCAGIALANGAWICMALLGIETMRGFEQILGCLRYLGGGYLFYLGVTLLRTKDSSGDDSCATVDIQLSEKIEAGKEGNNGIVAQPEAGSLKSFQLGFLSGILNPKNIIFYLALFTSLVSPETAFFKRLLYGVWMTSLVFVWDCGIILVVRKAGLSELSPRWTATLERCAGIALVGFGVLLPFT